MEEWLSEIISFVLGLFGGAGLKVVFDRRRISYNASDVTSSNQSGNIAGGDIAGRDKSGPS